MTRKKYQTSRPGIPIRLQRQVKIESGHKCAVNRCNSTTCEIHHIDGNRNNNSLDNLILLCRNHHKQAHEGIIDKESLIEYKKNCNFLDRKFLAEEFYKEHILELDNVLRLESWLDISYDLLNWKILNKFLMAFIDGVNLIDNTNYPEEYLELRDSIQRLRGVLVNLIKCFECDNVMLYTGILNYWMYKSWKAERWYSQDEYNKRYKEMEVWRDKIYEVHVSLIIELNTFAEEIWKHILPNYRKRQKFNMPCC